MKTIDEVIEILEKACDLERRCKDCSGCIAQEDGCPNDGAESIPDALFYLKQYRSDKALWAADKKGLEDWIEQYKDARDKHQQAVIELLKNDPLTWDELKSMEGKPVWVEALLYKQWAVIGYVGENHIRFEGVNLYAPESRQYMGADDGWQAYRKERK